MRLLRKDLRQVYLIKEYGRKFDDIMANLQSGSEKMLTHAMDIPFEEGDSIERTLPNGVTETYVIDAQ